MKRKYNPVYIDIVGHCNARCFYCHSGSEAILKTKRVISPENFDLLVTKLMDSNVISRHHTLSLYNWGEPFLHPDIAGIVGVIKKHHLNFSISTNASIIPKIDKDFAKHADTVMFSVSGFSKETYSRMHGFDFDRIIANISKIVGLVRRYNPLVKFVMLFHVYKFNQHELVSAMHFCDEHAILFNPYLAILNHWWKLEAFIKGQTCEQEKLKYSQELFDLKKILPALQNSPTDYHCPQFDMLNIDEQGNVVTCCQIPVDHEHYSEGNLLRNDNTLEMILKKNNHEGCKNCIESGFAFYINNSMTPAKYIKSRKQQLLSLIHRIISFLAKIRQGFLSR